MKNVAVIGYGYWGPNVVRNFNNHAECEVVYICDLDQGRRRRAKRDYSFIEITSNFQKVVNDESVDIVAIVTPVSTHFELAKSVLTAKKHLFIEKPMVQTVAQANELINICNKNNLIGVVDHTFLFTGAIKKIKEIIDSGEIGDLLYFDSTRVNLGIFQHDIDVIWDLAPHDLSILFYVSDLMPNSVMASGIEIVKNGLIDIGYLTLGYNSKMVANFHLNWFSPVKIRRIIFGGSKKMILFDDMETSEKIKVFDTGIDIIKDQTKIHELQVNYRIGDMYSPHLVDTEALKNEVHEFVDNINRSNFNNEKNSLKEGKKIVDILNLATQSLIKNSRVSIENGR